METRLFGVLDLQYRNSKCEENASELQREEWVHDLGLSKSTWQGLMANSSTQSGAIAVGLGRRIESLVSDHDTELPNELGASSSSQA